MLTALAKQDKENEYVFFMDSVTAKLDNFPPNVECIAVNLSQPPAQAASSSGRRSVPDILRMGKRVSKESLTLFFIPLSIHTFQSLAV